MEPCGEEKAADGP